MVESLLGEEIDFKKFLRQSVSVIDKGHCKLQSLLLLIQRNTVYIRAQLNCVYKIREAKYVKRIWMAVRKCDNSKES